MELKNILKISKLSKGTTLKIVNRFLKDKMDMLFAGDAAPLAYLELKSLGLPEERTPGLSADLCYFMEARFGVPPERVYIEFTSPSRHLFGWNGGTF